MFGQKSPASRSRLRVGIQRGRLGVGVCSDDVVRGEGHFEMGSINAYFMILVRVKVESWLRKKS